MRERFLRLVQRFRILIVGVGFALLYAVMLILALRYALHISSLGGATAVSSTGGQPATPEPWKQFSLLAPIFVALVTAVASALLSFFTLAVQLESQRSVEWLKKSIPSFGDLYASASSYYRALAPMETGHFDSGVAEQAETAMKNAEGASLFVPDDYAEAWRAFWQAARTQKEGAAGRNVAEQKNQWTQGVKEMGKRFNLLREIAQKHLKD